MANNKAKGAVWQREWPPDKEGERMKQKKTSAGKHSQTVPMTNAQSINASLQRLARTSRLPGRMLPLSNARDDIA